MIDLRRVRMLKVVSSQEGSETLNGPELASHAALLRDHLREVLESPAFRGSRRCQQFLRHIVEKAISGDCQDLKERTLGVDLFARSPSYDTSEDAIVRVTASDVRRRLHQVYGETRSAIRIEIPSGSYAPEFKRFTELAPPAAPPAPQDPSPEPLVLTVQPVLKPDHRVRNGLAVIGLVVVLVCFFIWVSRERLTPRNVFPWSALFHRDRPLQVVFADPDISTIQSLLGYQLSLSEYANRQYIRQTGTVGPDMQRALGTLRGANVPIVDAGIALDISSLAGASAARARVHGARSLQLRDIKSDDDFVFLGSPHSNPWTALFQDQLDFDFIYDGTHPGELIRNKRPRKGELGLYVPTAGGWATGQAFAVMAFVNNPSQAGHVLLLAGTDAEGTEAAGKIATNLDLLSRTLRKCGANPTGPPVRFELLLQVRTMAGSPATFDVLTCHLLQN